MPTQAWAWHRASPLSRLRVAEHRPVFRISEVCMVTTSLPVVSAAAKQTAAGIDYELFMDCVHCGLCLGSCPTYVETGDENDSPRGRIYLWRAVTDERAHLTDEVRQHLDLCL